MESLEVVQQITSVLAKRREILDLALDCGERNRMQIEEWCNTEMLLALSKLKKADKVDAFQAKRNYRDRLGQKFPQCDLWWRIADAEHWLEVKTINILDGKSYGSTGRDPQKWEGLDPTDIYHNLTIIWRIKSNETKVWASKLSHTYPTKEWTCEGEWGEPVWADSMIYFFLFTRKRTI